MSDVSTTEQQIDNAKSEAEYQLLQPKYEKLATEVEYIVRDALVEERVPIASLSKRAKTVASFAGKLRRKSYKDPLTHVTDLAGVRIVSYFRSDLVRLEQMIQRHFKVLEKVDKQAEKEPDQFGYVAIQFIVCLRDTYCGARYDDLHDLKCEIQTRGVLADAWAILNHHLVYKKESEVPSDITRRVNGLAAVVENAESVFDEIRREIETHREIAKNSTGSDFLNQRINPSTVADFIERMFPGIQREDKEQESVFICTLLDRNRFHTLADIEAAVQRTKNAVIALRKDTSMFAAQELEYALAFADTSMRRRYADWFEALFKKHRHLVKDLDSSSH